jgi:hypothetical protein
MKGTCSIDGCTRPRKYVSTGWCQTHYHRNYRCRAARSKARYNNRKDITP